ncbi:hypothetical protein [Streptomyces sp. NPDC002588]|uniref:hypothetical protein n=1 Tax=Streptomyces sp. NPDC002588 TaxID=3154419 RepID=UPI00332BDA4C
MTGRQHREDPDGTFTGMVARRPDGRPPHQDEGRHQRPAARAGSGARDNHGRHGPPHPLGTPITPPSRRVER